MDGSINITVVGQISSLSYLSTHFIIIITITIIIIIIIIIIISINI